MTIARRALAALPVLAAIGGSAARAQAPSAAPSSALWPNRPVRIIVPFPAGSTPDIAMRPVAAALARAYGQPFVVENRAGAAGTIGIAAVAAATDGHTLGLANNGTIATAKAIFPNLPYDPARDLRPVAMLVAVPFVVAVGPSARATDLRGLLARAKAEPGRLSYGSIGVGSAGHLAMEELKAAQGVDLVHVPYRGFPEVAIDLAAGRIEATICPVATVAALHRERQVTILAATGDARLAAAPDVPTVAEAGFPDATVTGWNGVFAPASVPSSELRRLNAEICRALAEPAIREGLTSAGFVMDCTPQERFAAFVASETERWSGLVRRLGVRADA